MQTLKLIGPPGTGKTTELINRVREELRHLDPQAIGYYSFTRAAANVARGRALDTFPNLTKEDLPHFRTVHSECFRILRDVDLIDGEHVMTPKHWNEFGELYGYVFSDKHRADGEDELREVTLNTTDDWLKFFNEWRRSLMLFDLEKAYERFWMRNRNALPRNWPIGAIALFLERLEAYKKEFGLWEFHDMLIEVLRRRLFPMPGIRVLMKDEAQDSSPLIYEVIKIWLEGVERYYIAGDPAQAIYTWQGANPALFEGISADSETILSQSHRLPRAVHSFAIRILEAPEYYPRDAEGLVDVASLGHLLDEIDDLDGEIFILVRNRYLLQQVIDALYQWQVPFGNLRGESPFQGNDAVRLLTLRRLMRREQVSCGDLYRLIEKVPYKGNFNRGLKAKIRKMAQEQAWITLSLTEIEDDVAGFFKDPMRRIGLTPLKLAYYVGLIDKHGETVLQEPPRVLLGTIHSVKGMECDWVILLTEMSRKTWLGSLEQPEEEARVWYTGCTRPRQGLFLVPSDSSYEWRWPSFGTLNERGNHRCIYA